VVPHLRLPAKWPSGVRIAALVLVGGSLVGYNAWQRVKGVDDVEVLCRETRDGVEAVAGAVAGGEPAIDGLRLLTDLGVPGAAGLEVGDVRALVADGWRPAARPERVAAMQPVLRMRAAEGPLQGASGYPLALAGGSEGGCAVIDGGRAVTARVIGTGWVSLARDEGRGRGKVLLTWRDGFGEFPLQVVFERRRAVELAPPVGETTVVVRNSSRDPLALCGLSERPEG
jgi:hypothetical protein